MSNYNLKITIFNRLYNYSNNNFKVLRDEYFLQIP